MIPRLNIAIPETMDGALEILKTQNSLPLCGGTDLVVLLRRRRIAADDFVCIDRIPELKAIEDMGDSIFVGAACTFSEIEKNELIRNTAPLLASAAGMVASPPIRNRATIGGNVQNASPAGDGLVALYGEKAVVVIESHCGSRVVPVRDFVIQPGKTKLKKEELIKGFTIPKKSNVYNRFFKVGRRNALAISVVNGCVSATCEEGVLSNIEVVLGAVGPKPICITELNEQIGGKCYTAEIDEMVQAIVERSISPIDDVRASSEYRRYIAGISVRRALREAAGGRR